MMRLTILMLLGLMVAKIFPMEDNNRATSWIDSIIMDLIHNSAHVSIPQLIHNIREIIHPCNPNLAALIEYRLRSLTSSVDAAADTIVPDNYQLKRRRKESISAADNMQRQECYFQLQGQGQLLAGSSGLKLYLDDDNLLSHTYTPLIQESHNQYLNWEFALPTTNTSAAGGNGQQHLCNNTPTASATGDSYVTSAAIPNFTNQVLPQSQQQQQSSEPETQASQQSEQQHQDSPPNPDDASAAAASTSRSLKKRRNSTAKERRTRIVPVDLALTVCGGRSSLGGGKQHAPGNFGTLDAAGLVSSCLGIYVLLPAVAYSQKMVSACQVFNGISPL